MFPILGKLEWSWWKRTTEWPFFPITPTFPLLPVPLPTKWHFQFLPAIHLADHYPPEAAADARIVQRIGEEIRAQMQLALTTLRERRRSIFYGSIFGPADGQSTSADILAEPIVSRSSPAEHSAV
jgi:hypothetical protein